MTLALDVGANAGQTGLALRREVLFPGRIVSFEPQADLAERLAQAAAGDPLWECRQIALGDQEGVLEIHRSENDGSSSFLAWSDGKWRTAAGTRYVGAEKVRVMALDDVAPELVGPEDRLYLKLDVQGYEMHVLRGAARTLTQVEVINAELNLAELYEGQPDLRSTLDHLDDFGFDLVALEPAWSDPDTGHMLQADGIFVRRPGERVQPADRVTPGSRSPSDARSS